MFVELSSQVNPVLIIQGIGKLYYDVENAIIPHT